MKSLFIITACALIGLALSSNCKSCSKNRKKNPRQDCILFANDQDENFYTEEFLDYTYGPCHDPEEIIAAENSNITCIPLIGNKPLRTNQQCEAGEYKHYHWTIQDYDVINDNAGSTIEFILTPCNGHPEIFIKPQILYAGIPMCQLFETMPGTEGSKTDTWPFPNKDTGTGQQGPDKELFELERKAKKEGEVLYPGSFFSKQPWGHSGSLTSEDGRPQPQKIRIPSISYGGFFVSVYCKTASVFEVGIVAQKQVDAVRERRADKDEDRLAMKIRRFGYEVDDTHLESNWGDLKRKHPTKNATEFLQADGFDCPYTPKIALNTTLLGIYSLCSRSYYMEKYGLAALNEDTKMGAHHPEVAPKLLGIVDEINGDFCYNFHSAKTCSENCCKWSPDGDLDIADFLKFGPFRLRSQIENHTGICRPATTMQSLCVTPKKQDDMSTDNKECTDDEDRDQGGCERNIQATMEVTFYTGEIGDEDNDDTWPLFQVQYVEMNNCVGQLDKIGQNYCWEADDDRYILEFEENTTKTAGQDGYKWSHTCGDGSGDKKCDPSHQSRGKCFWDGTLDNTKANQTTRDTQWSKNADDCVMWTACGVKRNGMPVMIEHKRGSKELIQREIPARDRSDTKFEVKDSIYLYGHVTPITMESMESTSQNRIYNRYVLEDQKTWLKHPPRRWVRVEIPVFNNVTYFFNVLRNVTSNGTSVVESYTGVSAVTTFYHKTQLFSDTTILIIAAVVVVALLFLLIPFIFTKQKIKEHLRQVYEKHKERGQARAKEAEGEAEKGDTVVNYAAREADKSGTVVGYEIQDIAAAEKEDPALRKKDSAEPTKGGNSMSM